MLLLLLIGVTLLVGLQAYRGCVGLISRSNGKICLVLGPGLSYVASFTVRPEGDDG